MSSYQKNTDELQIMAEGGKILAQALTYVAALVKPGIRTLELDKAAEQFIVATGAKPAFKGYDGFPFTLCASVNNVIVHGLPSDYVLQGGDIIGLDLGVIWKEYYSDSAVTVGVGNISPKAKQLISVTKQSLAIGLTKVKPGATTGDVGFAIQNFAESQGYGVIRNLCGHGIGRDLHEDPQVPNYGNPGEGTVLQEGMVMCIEPMITAGDWKIKKAPDGYGIATRDGSLAAHVEHTIEVTAHGYTILTSV